MTDDTVVDLREDWEFHQATGMVSVQMGDRDMERAVSRIVSVAMRRGESVHDVSVGVIDGHLRLGNTDGATGADAARDRDAELRAVRSELYELLHQRPSWTFDGDEAARYTKLARREVVLLGLPSDERPAPQEAGWAW